MELLAKQSIAFWGNDGEPEIQVHNPVLLAPRTTSTTPHSRQAPSRSRSSSPATRTCGRSTTACRCVAPGRLGHAVLNLPTTSEVRHVEHFISMPWLPATTGNRSLAVRRSSVLQAKCHVTNRPAADGSQRSRRPGRRAGPNVEKLSSEKSISSRIRRAGTALRRVVLGREHPPDGLVLGRRVCDRPGRHRDHRGTAGEGGRRKVTG